MFKLHKALVDPKSTRHRRKPGLKGPSPELIAAIVAMKLRNAKFGCVRIAQQIFHGFGIEVDKDVVRRVLTQHFRPDDAGPNGPSWLALMAQSKDSLWSVDLFRCESILLHSYRVLVVMDIFTRRIVGFGVARDYIDGVTVCRMFNHAVAGQPCPRRLSKDHDPLFRFHRWLANLRVLESEKIKSVPCVPMSHPFIERLIATVRRDYLDRLFFWNSVDLIRKLAVFRDYYNEFRVHRSLGGTKPCPESRSGIATACYAQYLRMAAALPGSIPDSGRSRLTTNSPPTGSALYRRDGSGSLG